jgi:5-methylcytosine-specific restriction endonuclease McrA
MSSYKLYPKYTPGTYHSRDVFQRVVETRDLRIPWAYKSAVKWGVDAEQFLSLCGPTCKCCDSPLDYGVGKNNHGKRDINTPSTDHIVSQHEAKSLGWTDEQIHDITNLWIICNRCNLLKNNSTAADAFRYERIARVLREGINFGKKQFDAKP